MGDVEHKPMPKTWTNTRGTKIELLGTSHWLRCPMPAEHTLTMNDKTVWDLAHNHPGYKYEWVYIQRKATT